VEIYQDPATSPQRRRWPLAADGWSSAPDPLARAAQHPPPCERHRADDNVHPLGKQALQGGDNGTNRESTAAPALQGGEDETIPETPSPKQAESNSRRVIRPPTSGLYICNAQTQVVQIRMRALPGLTNSKWSSNLASALVCLHPLAAPAAAPSAKRFSSKPPGRAPGSASEPQAKARNALDAGCPSSSRCARETTMHVRVS
jgi:hypothetical protein